MRWPVLLCCGAVLWGCAKDRIDPQLQALLDKPGWVSGDSSQYPKHLFFTAHGVSANLDTAKRQAIDGIAGQFRREVAKYFKAHGPKERAVSSAKLKDGIKSDRVLSRRQIADIWQDPSSKSYHVLTVIDRVQVGNDIKDEIDHINVQIQRVLNKAGEQSDALQRIAYANIALEKISEYEQLQSSLNVLNPSAAQKSSQWTPDDIRSQVYQWLSEVKVLPVLENNNPDLKRAFSGGVKSAGFIVDYGAKPDFVLKAWFKQGQVKWNDGVYTLGGNLRLELRDGDWKRQVRGAMNWPIQVTAPERDMLSGKLASAIKQLNEQKLKSVLIELGSD